LAANVAIQAGIGGVYAAPHHVVGTKPFWTEAKQRGTDLKTYTLSDTHTHTHSKDVLHATGCASVNDNPASAPTSTRMGCVSTEMFSRLLI